MNSDRITCLIPTHNRPQFLRRLLWFYAQHPPRFPFIVIDSSRPELAAENRSVVEQALPNVSVKYRHVPQNFYDKCVVGMREVQTPYSVFCADDDLLFSDAVWRCADFLENEPGYASAMGRTAQLNPKLPQWCCRVLRGYSVEHETPLERCRQLASHWFTNFYAVYRTETLREMFEITAANTDASINYHAPEMMMSQLSAIRGRIKVFPTIYSLMESHGSNAGAAMRVGVRQHAEELYQRFRDCLATEFVRSGTSRRLAESFIDESFSFFSESNLAVRRQRRSPAAIALHLLHGLIEKIQGLVEPSFNKHRRLVRASDLKDCLPAWNAAVSLIRDYPLGMPQETQRMQRCA